MPCSTGVGAVLTQLVDAVWKPVAYFSKKFPTCTKAYASREAEAYGIYLAVLHWRVWLLGNHFTIISDHQSLALSAHGHNSRRIQRWLLGLSEFRFDIRYRRGILHSAPDALSRIWSVEPSGDEPEVLAFGDGKEEEPPDEPEETDPAPVELEDDSSVVIPTKEEWALATQRCRSLAPIARILAGDVSDDFPWRAEAQRMITRYDLELIDGVVQDGSGVKWVPEEYRSLMHPIPCNAVRHTP